MNEVKDRVGFLREGLFAKYVVALVGLVVFVLAINGAMEVWITYRGIKSSLNDGMSEKAEATAKRIQQSLSDLERQISWVTRASSNTTDLRRADYTQLLRQVPQVRAGKLKLDELITNTYTLDDIGQGFQDMLDGKNIRGVVIHEH